MDKKKTVDEAKTIIKRAERKKPELIKIKTEIAQVVAVSRVTARETKQTKTNVKKKLFKKEVEEFRIDIHKAIERNETLKTSIE